MSRIEAIERDCGIRFLNEGLLEQALTHRSFSAENDVPDNERLEFLGDAILNASTTILITNHFSNEDEGGLSRIRAKLVSTKTLAEIGRDLELGQHLRLGRGEDQTGGRDKRSILADSVEALLGAMFLDQGFEACRKWVNTQLESRILELNEQTTEHRFKDHRSKLQEIIQKRSRVTPSYHMVSCDGPPHSPVFTMEVRAGDNVLATAEGSSKRDASQNAAKLAIESLEVGVPS